MAVPKKKSKPSAQKAEKSTLSAADFKKLFKGKSKIWDRSKKKSAPTGYVEDSEVIEAFGLRPGKGVTTKARLTKAEVVRFGDSDPIAQMTFVVTEGPNQGMPLQSSVWLSLSDDEKLEKALDSISFILQKLGYETDELTLDNLAEVLEELTSEKPYCVIYLTVYVLKSGKNKGAKKYNVRVNAAYSPSEDEDADEGDEEEDTEDDEEGDDSEEDDSDDSEDEDESSEEESEDDVEYEEEDEEETEEEEEGPDEDDPATWVGYKVKAKVKGKTITGDITKYDAKKSILTLKAGKNTHQIKPEDVEDWA